MPARANSDRYSRRRASCDSVSPSASASLSMVTARFLAFGRDFKTLCGEMLVVTTNSSVFYIEAALKDWREDAHVFAPCCVKAAIPEAAKFEKQFDTFSIRCLVYFFFGCHTIEQSADVAEWQTRSAQD